MRFESETSVFKFLRRREDGALNMTKLFPCFVLVDGLTCDTCEHMSLITRIFPKNHACGLAGSHNAHEQSANHEVLKSLHNLRNLDIVRPSLRGYSFMIGMCGSLKDMVFSPFGINRASIWAILVIKRPEGTGFFTLVVSWVCF